jgi:hypothetical protein
MARRYRIAAVLMLAAFVTSCGDSNPFVGKWELADNSKTDADCVKAFDALDVTDKSPRPNQGALEVTDKSLRSNRGIWLYTLTEDGDDYIFDAKDKATILATTGKSDTMILNFGSYTCTMRHPKK